MYILTFLVFLITSCSAEYRSPNPTLGINSKDVPCRVVHVSDGDTFRCMLSSGEEIKVRLIGVDTPESHANPKAERDSRRSGIDLEDMIKMGQEAYRFTKGLIDKKTVYLETDVQLTDRYGRILAYVWLDRERMLNEVLVREGYAQVYTIPPNVKYQERFLKAQRMAREEGKGFWKGWKYGF